VSLRCPDCKKHLPVHIVRKSFTCPSCGAALAANTTLPLICAWLAWSLMDFGMQPEIYSRFGYAWWPGMTLRVVASLLVALALIWVIFSVFVKVRRESR
jgi:hypothetical protein